MEPLISGAEKLGIRIKADQLEKFTILLNTLLEWNKTMNLTGITDPKEVIIKHFLDSLTVLPHIPNNARTYIDVGTGAGFPGLVVAIMKPKLNITLLEAAAKKVSYLEACITALELDPENVQSIHGRAEDLAKMPEFRESFDIGTARAVALLPTLSEYVLPLIKKDGIFIAQKKAGTDEVDQASNAIKLLGAEVESSQALNLEELPERQIIIIKKISKTPDMYPRRSGMPLKKPLV